MLSATKLSDTPLELNIRDILAMRFTLIYVSFVIRGLVPSNMSQLYGNCRNIS